MFDCPDESEYKIHSDYRGENKKALCRWFQSDGSIPFYFTVLLMSFALMLFTELWIFWSLGAILIRYLYSKFMIRKCCKGLK